MDSQPGRPSCGSEDSFCMWKLLSTYRTSVWALRGEMPDGLGNSTDHCSLSRIRHIWIWMTSCGLYFHVSLTLIQIWRFSRTLHTNSRLPKSRYHQLLPGRLSRQWIFSVLDKLVGVVGRWICGVICNHIENIYVLLQPISLHPRNFRPSRWFQKRNPFWW